MKTEAERIAKLETQMEMLLAQSDCLDKKMDEILALRNKGAGVFWFISTIAGSGILGVLWVVIDWYKGGV